MIRLLTELLFVGLRLLTLPLPGNVSRTRHRGACRWGSFIHLFLHSCIHSRSGVYNEPRINAGSRPWSGHDLHPRRIHVPVRQDSRNKQRAHKGGNRVSNMWWCVWVGGLREDLTEETGATVWISEAAKWRQVPTEAHTCKCKPITKRKWLSQQDDGPSKRTSSHHPLPSLRSMFSQGEVEGRLGCARGIYRPLNSCKAWHGMTLV